MDLPSFHQPSVSPSDQVCRVRPFAVHWKGKPCPAKPALLAEEYLLLQIPRPHRLISISGRSTYWQSVTSSRLRQPLQPSLALLHILVLVSGLLPVLVLVFEGLLVDNVLSPLLDRGLDHSHLEKYRDRSGFNSRRLHRQHWLCSAYLGSTSCGDYSQLRLHRANQPSFIALHQERKKVRAS